MGISAAIAAVAAEVGVGAETAAVIGTVGAGALEGAAGGAAFGAATGGDPGLGALTGAVSGGALGGLGGAGGLVDSATGLGAVGSDALIGAGAGALGAGITGTDPLTGAVQGGVTGAGAGLLGGSSPDTTSPQASSATAGEAAQIAQANTGAALGASTSGMGTAGPAAAGGAAPGDLGVKPIPTDVSGGTATNLGDFVPTSDVSGAVSSGGIPGAVQGGEGLGIQSPGAMSELTAANPAQAGLPQASNFEGMLKQQTDLGNTGADTGTPGTAAAKAGGNSITNAIKEPSLGNIGTALSSNANLLLPAGVLGLEALTQPSVGDPNATLSSLGGIAGNLQKSSAGLLSQGQSLTAQGQTAIAAQPGAGTIATGEALTNALNGQLPPGAKAAVDQASQAAKASIRSRYAEMGITDSTMIGEALAQVDQQAAAQTFQMANALVTQGLNAISTGTQQNSQAQQVGLGELSAGTSQEQLAGTQDQLTAQIYQQIMAQQLGNDKELSQALATFAASMAGGGVNIRVGG